MRSYQKAQPLIQALCAEHGVPYIKEPVLKRALDLVDIMVGKIHAQVPVPCLRARAGHRRGRGALGLVLGVRYNLLSIVVFAWGWSRADAAGRRGGARW